MGQSLAETRALADLFFEQENYEQALLCYQRTAFFSRPEADPDVFARIAECFYATGDFNRALEYFDHAYFAQPDSLSRLNYLFEKTRTLLETENYHFALVELLSHDFPDSSQAFYRQQLYLGASYFGLEQFEQAGKHFTAALPASAADGRRAIMELYDTPKKFERPYPKLALYMSAVLPGSGQFYAGDIAGGLNSFLLTGGLISSYFLLIYALHPIDAIMTILPWFQRYYQGGFDQAEIIAINKRQNRRNAIYQETIEILANYQ